MILRIVSIFIYNNAAGHIRLFLVLTECFNILKGIFFPHFSYACSKGKGRMANKALICSTFLILLELLDLIDIAASKG